MGFWVFLVQPTVVSVLLSASVKRCFVSRMRDFFLYVLGLGKKIIFKVPFYMSEVTSGHIVCFGAFLRHTTGF